VLSLFMRMNAVDPALAIHGQAIVDETEIESGSLYPILHRLHKSRLLIAEWEELETAVSEGRRPRCRYRLDPDRMDDAQEIIRNRSASARKVAVGQRLLGKLIAQAART
jgi:DNA-binding PadR family transcriptional regulator